MSDRIKALGGLAIFTVVVYLAAGFVPHDRFLDVSVWLVTGMAIPATLFTLGYMFTSPWWTTGIGRAMLISTTALAMLVDSALLAYWGGGKVSEQISLTVYAWIFLGAWWKLGAFVVAKWRERHSSDQSHFTDDH